MTRVLHRARGAVTLVGGGPVGSAQLRAALALAPEAVAADGGGDVVLPPGVRFTAIIGDLDSLTGGARLRAEGVPVHRLAEQDTTDLEKCLYSVEAPLFLGVGFVGGRIDHDLAAYNVVAKRPDKRLVLIGPEDICFLCPPVLDLGNVAAGTRVSLFPFGPARGTLSEGLRWPVAGLALAPAARTATSNEATGGPIRIGFEGGPVLVILPTEFLPTVAEILGS